METIQAPRRKLMVMAMIGWVSLPACATYYEIGSGYTSLTLEDHDSLLMTGGGIGILGLFDYSTATILNTSAFQTGIGGIERLELAGYSHLNFSGGEIVELDMGSYATATLSGGSIVAIYSNQYVYPDGPHITLVYSGDIPTVESVNGYDVLVGIWGNGSDFSIYLTGLDGYSPAIENIRFELIPEPATLALLGLGMLAMRRRP